MARRNKLYFDITFTASQTAVAVDPLTGAGDRYGNLLVQLPALTAGAPPEKLRANDVMARFQNGGLVQTLQSLFHGVDFIGPTGSVTAAAGIPLTGANNAGLSPVLTGAFRVRVRRFDVATSAGINGVVNGVLTVERQHGIEI